MMGGWPGRGFVTMISRSPRGPIDRLVRVGRPHAVEGQIQNILPILPWYFDWCPICLSPNQRSREHVLQAGLGGAVLTVICEPCILGLGSRLEASLLDWFRYAVVDARISCESIPGQMREGKVCRRSTQDDRPVWLFPRDIQPRARGA